MGYLVGRHPDPYKHRGSLNNTIGRAGMFEATERCQVATGAEYIDRKEEGED